MAPLACPRCGAAADVQGSYPWSVACPDCYDGPEDALYAWSTRSVEASVALWNEKVEDLEALHGPALAERRRRAEEARSYLEARRRGDEVVPLPSWLHVAPARALVGGA